MSRCTPTRGREGPINISTSRYTGGVCDWNNVTIGISHPDLGWYRQQQAYRKDGSYFSARIAVPPNVPGTWITRQIAVKDGTGKVVVRQFTAATTPTKVVIKRESIRGMSKYDVRLAFCSPYQSIANDWYYVGRIA